MAFVKANKFELDRRQLLKMVGTMGVGASFLTPQQLLAMAKCEMIETENGTVEAEKAGRELQYWIDGLHLGTHSTLRSRANLSVFMDLKQSEASYVEAVVLLDNKNRTLGARYFDPSMKQRSNHVPYVVFESVELAYDLTYSVIYQVKTGSKVTLYTAEIGNPKLSTLNTSFLPTKIKEDFEHFLLNDREHPTPGLLTTPFQYYTHNGLWQHCSRGRVTSIDSTTGDFEIDIDYMHSDTTAQDDNGQYYHFMRYFLVLDPVGRILGVLKRDRPGSVTGGDGQTSGSKIVSRLTKDQIGFYELDDTQVPDIRDCPYVQIYTEDSFDAMARSVIRLR